MSCSSFCVNPEVGLTSKCFTTIAPHTIRSVTWNSVSAPFPLQSLQKLLASVLAHSQKQTISSLNWATVGPSYLILDQLPHSRLNLYSNVYKTSMFSYKDSLNISKYKEE